MDTTVAHIAVFTAFLLIYLAIWGFTQRQSERDSIDRDVDSVTNKVISNVVIPKILDIFEYEPPAIGESHDIYIDKLSVSLQSGLSKIAKALKCQSVARHFGRCLFWGCLVGVLAEMVFIAVSAFLSSDIFLWYLFLCISFIILALCFLFIHIRYINIQQAEDIDEGVI